MNINSTIKLNSGYEIPIMGFGTSMGNGEEMRKAIHFALEVGYRSIDTAFQYHNEEAIGDALQECLSKNKYKRSDIFVTTKLPCIGNRPGDVRMFLGKSLKKLKLDYVDLYLIHVPFGVKYICDEDNFSKDEFGNSIFDFETDLEAVWKEMEKQVDEGRAKSIGISNFNSEQMDRIMRVAKILPAVNQVEVHVYLQQHDLIKKCQELGIVVTAYSPIGAPYIAQENQNLPPILKNPKILEIAERHGKSSSQVLLKFLLQRNIPLIPKSVTPERIRSNIDLYDFRLSDEEMEELRKLDSPADGRVYHFKNTFVGVEKHKEYPFHIPF